MILKRRIESLDTVVLNVGVSDEKRALLICGWSIYRSPLMPSHLGIHFDGLSGIV